MNKKDKPVRCGCGGEAKVYQAYDSSYCVQCSKCGMTTLYTREPEQAITAWNWAMGAERCCNTCDSYEAGRYCLLWSIFCRSDHWCKDWSGNE